MQFSFINFLGNLSSLRNRLVSLAPLVLLLVVAVVSYGLNAPRLGFFWDSWPMNWIAQTRGAAGLSQYFSTNRPVWGLLYQATTALVGISPLAWQVFGLLWHWLAAAALWGLLRLLQPGNPTMAIWAGLLFIVYPGFQQSSIALLYGHFFIVFFCLLASLSCSLLAQRHPAWRWPLLAVGMLLSAANLLMMEYFFLLELLRPFLLWFSPAVSPLGRLKRVRAVLAVWLPYLMLFIAAALWRAVFFPYQTNNYKLVILDQLKTQPFQTLLHLSGKALEQIGISSGQAWLEVLSIFLPASGISVNRLRLILLAGGVLAVILIFAWIFRRLFHPFSHEQLARSSHWQVLTVAILSLGLAGWPFWLTDVPFRLEFAFDRFTLPFTIGACLLVAWLLERVPWRAMGWTLLAAVVGLGVAFQYQTGLAYRLDWEAQQQFFWQLTWRAPTIQPGTLVIANETSATAFSTDNSLSAALNWIYDPANRSQTLNYMLVYPTIRLGGSLLPALEANTPSTKDYLVAVFVGNTSRSIAVHYDGTGCLRVLDPTIDAADPTLPDDLQRAAAFSDLNLIQAEPGVSYPPLPAILGTPPTSSWCYHYEKASLLRQSGQWYNILQVWEEAIPVREKARPIELLPFIEAYARSGRWEEAAALTPTESQSRPVYCALWKQLAQTVPTASSSDKALASIQQSLGCKLR